MEKSKEWTDFGLVWYYKIALGDTVRIFKNRKEQSSEVSAPAASAAGKRCSACSSGDALPRAYVEFSGAHVAKVEGEYDGRLCVNCCNKQFKKLGFDVRVTALGERAREAGPKCSAVTGELRFDDDPATAPAPAAEV